MEILKGQVAVVTGAGRGIGGGIARALGAAGAHVECLARNEKELDRTVREIEERGGTAAYRVVDVKEPNAVAATVNQIVSDRNQIDVWVNNAGRFHAIGPVWEADPQDWWHDVTVNVYGTFLCTRAVLPHMFNQGTGRIINLVGGGTAGPFAYGSGYGSSKSAVARFTDSLALELEGTPIKVFALGPGLVLTGMTQYQLDTEAGRKYMGRIHDMFDRGQNVPSSEAGRVALFLASGRADNLSGRIFDVRDDLEEIIRDQDAILHSARHALRVTG